MASAKKTASVEKDETTSNPKRYRGWDMSRIFWGLLLVLVGVLALLDNLNVVEVHYGNLWQLWPLLIVGWGVSLLNIKGTLWSIVSALLMLGSLGLVAWTATGMAPFQTGDNSVQTQRIEKTGSTVNRLDVTVEAGAGNITIGSHESEAPVEAVLDSDFATLDVDSRIDGNTQKVDVSMDGNRMWWSGHFRNDLDVTLAKQLPVFLNVKTGASDLNANLSKVMLERLDMNLGANSSDVTLGDLVDRVEVSVSAGASSITLRAPKDSGVSVKLDKGVSSQDLDGLQDKGSGFYETDGFDTASKKIIVRGDLGAA
ncbi:hypothetical protein GW746_02575, partial [Candidatus Saccharibacteria bacterium]|nr:hypothetical protein [Candidatus Saccharibacteria bacterium]